MCSLPFADQHAWRRGTLVPHPIGLNSDVCLATELMQRFLKSSLRLFRQLLQSAVRKPTGLLTEAILDRESFLHLRRERSHCAHNQRVLFFDPGLQLQISKRASSGLEPGHAK